MAFGPPYFTYYVKYRAHGHRCSEAVPSVMFVRTYLRANKGENVARWPVLAAGAIATVGACLFFRYGMAPRATAVALLALFARSLVFLAFPRPQFRARTIGFIELGCGLGLVATAAVAWRALLSS